MTATIITSGFNVLAHSGVTFRSANEVSHLITRKEASTLRSQPGYRRGETMTVLFTTSGAPRLYVRVDRDWMDASMEDLPTGH